MEPKKLQEAGYAYGDILAVTIDGKTYQIPLCTNYSDVDTGSYVVRDNDDELTIAINMGDFATTNGIAEKITAEDKSFTWVFPEGKSIEDLEVSISMGEKGEYYDQYLLHQLVRTNDRTDITDYIAQECFDSPYYASLYQAGKVKALNLSLNFEAEDFKEGLAEGLRFFTANEGPYLVHCDEGKDRAGSDDPGCLIRSRI